jgi:hypothetical protein
MVTKEWVEAEITLDIVPDSYPHACRITVAGIRDAAEAIAQAAERDRADALAQCRAEMVGQVQDLEAKVALMSEALNRLCRAVRYGTDDDRQRAYDHAQQALSAAPRVLARVRMALDREPTGRRFLTSKGHEAHYALATLGYGEDYDVIVLAAESERPTSSEQEGKDAEKG